MTSEDLEPSMIEPVDEAQRALEQMNEMMASLQAEIDNEGRKISQMKELRAQWRREHPAARPSPLAHNIKEYHTLLGCPDVEIHHSPTKGRILLAKRSFEVTELILVEGALVLASDEANKDDQRRVGALFAAWSVIKAMAGLRDDQMTLILDLANVHEDSRTLFMASIEALREDGVVISSQTPQEIAHLIGICQTNSFEFDGADKTRWRGLFPLSAMMSHSCLPNALFVIEDEKLFLHAIEPIPAGAEICVSYIKRYSPTETRRAQLLEKYGFLCRCPSCAGVA